MSFWGLKMIECRLWCGVILYSQGDCGGSDWQEALQTLFSVIFSMTRLMVGYTMEIDCSCLANTSKITVSVRAEVASWLVHWIPDREVWVQALTRVLQTNYNHNNPKTVITECHWSWLCLIPLISELLFCCLLLFFHFRRHSLHLSQNTLTRLCGLTYQKVWTLEKQRVFTTWWSHRPGIYYFILLHVSCNILCTFTLMLHLFGWILHKLIPANTLGNVCTLHTCTWCSLILVPGIQ